MEAWVKGKRKEKVREAEVMKRNVIVGDLINRESEGTFKKGLGKKRKQLKKNVE